jgi:hypothetical protein
LVRLADAEYRCREEGWPGTARKRSFDRPLISRKTAACDWLTHDPFATARRSMRE